MATQEFFYSGSNDNYRAWIEGYLQSRDGFVILTNSSNGSLLRLEIRRALSDAIGLGVDPVLRTVDLDANDPIYTNYKGTYRLDSDIPMNIRGRFADDFDVEAFRHKYLRRESFVTRSRLRSRSSAKSSIPYSVRRRGVGNRAPDAILNFTERTWESAGCQHYKRQLTHILPPRFVCATRCSIRFLLSLRMST